MNDKWNDRIKNTEINPPADGWNKISSSLDDSFNGLKFPVALYNFEEAPPADTWNKILSGLDEQTGLVVPLKKTFHIPVFLKYAIAACFIGVLSFVAIKFFNTDAIKVDTAVVERNTKKPSDTVKKTDQPVILKEQPAPTENKSDDQALEQSKHMYAALDAPVSLTSKIKSRLYKSPAQLASSFSESSYLKTAELQYPHRAAVNDSPAREADRYLMYKNSDGQFIRISKKLVNMFCCVSGEEQDDNCTDQLKKWREKIAASSFVPSPDNFMDILDLVNSLEDNHN